MVFTKLLLENALAIRPCNCGAASKFFLPKVDYCIPVLSSRYAGKAPQCFEALCFSLTIGDSYEIDLFAKHRLSSQLLVMCRRNRNDFYSTAGLNGCPEYLSNKDCYDSLAVLLTQIQYCSLLCNRRLLPMYEYQVLQSILRLYEN